MGRILKVKTLVERVVNWKGKVKKMEKRMKENQGKTPPPGTIYSLKKDKKGRF